MPISNTRKALLLRLFAFRVQAGPALLPPAAVEDWVMLTFARGSGALKSLSASPLQTRGATTSARFVDDVAMEESHGPIEEGRLVAASTVAHVGEKDFPEKYRVNTYYYV